MKNIPYLCIQPVTFDSCNIAEIKALRYNHTAKGITLEVVDCLVSEDRNFDETALINYLLRVATRAPTPISGIADLQRGRSLVALNSRRGMANVILIHPETLKQQQNIMTHFQNDIWCEVFAVDVDALRDKAICLYRAVPGMLNTKMHEIDGAPILGVENNRVALLRDGASKYTIVQDFALSIHQMSIGVRL